MKFLFDLLIFIDAHPWLVPLTKTMLEYVWKFVVKPHYKKEESPGSTGDSSTNINKNENKPA
jgi:hypothetical protein